MARAAVKQGEVCDLASSQTGFRRQQHDDGVPYRLPGATSLSMSRLFSWDFCLCYVESATSAQIRYAVRRVRRRAPEALILVALFGSNITQIESEGLGGDTQFVQSSFRATVDKIVAAASEP